MTTQDTLNTALQNPHNTQGTTPITKEQVETVIYALQTITVPTSEKVEWLLWQAALTLEAMVKYLPPEPQIA